MNNCRPSGQINCYGYIQTALLALWCLLFSNPGFALFSSEKWTEYQTDNFILISKEPPEDAQKIVQNLERFRSGVLLVLDLEDNPTKNRPIIFSFPELWDYFPFENDPSVLGFHIANLEGTYIAIGPSRSSRLPASTIYHEYIHFLMRERTARVYPHWYDEGFTQIFETNLVHDDYILINTIPHEYNIPADHIDENDRIDVRSLIERDKYLYRGNHENRLYFYYAGWALTHYLTLGYQTGNPDYRDQLSRFLQLYSSGVSEVEAFKQAFENKTFDDLSKEVTQYLKANKTAGFKINLPAKPYPVKAKVLSSSEYNLYLSRLAVALGNSRLSNKYVNKAVKGKGVSAEAYSYHATLMAGSKKMNLEKEQDYLREALKSPTPRVHVDHARYCLSLFENEKNESKRKEYYKCTVEHADKAIKLGTTTPDAYVYKAMAAARMKESKIATKYILEAVTLMPSNVDLNLMAAGILADNHSFGNALFFSDRVISWSHDANQIKAAKAIKDFSAKAISKNSVNKKSD